MKTIAAALLCTVSLGPFDPGGPSFVGEDDAEPSGDRILWAPVQGLVLDKRLESSAAVTAETLTMRRGDEEEVQELDQEFEQEITIVLRDVYEVLSAERLVIRRAFEELTDRTSSSDGEQSEERTSPFEGLTVRIDLHLGEREKVVTIVDESPANAEAEEMLDRLNPFAADLVAFLPDGPVEVGDSWDVEFGEFRWDVLRPCGDLGWRLDPPNPPKEWVRNEVFEGYDGTIEATYARREEIDVWNTIAVIEFEGSYECDVELDVPRNAPAPSRVVCEYEVEGTLEWSLSRRTARRLTVTIRGTRAETHERETEEGELVTLELEMDVEWESEFTYE